MDKLTMAHEWAVKFGKSTTIMDRENTVDYAWEYADAMQAEADKRKKEEVEEASKEMASILENHKCSYLHGRICWCGKIKT